MDLTPSIAHVQEQLSQALARVAREIAPGRVDLVVAGENLDVIVTPPPTAPSVAETLVLPDPIDPPASPGAGAAAADGGSTARRGPLPGSSAAGTS